MEKNAKWLKFRRELLLLTLTFFFYIEMCGAIHSFFIVCSSNDSLQSLINNAVEGSTIYLEPKIYYENKIIINKSITIIGRGMDKTIIDGNYETFFIFHIVADNVEIKNLTIRNTGSTQIGVATAITISDSSYVKISKCKIENTEGLNLMKSTSCYVTNNLFISNTYAAITLNNSSRNVISYNTFLNNTKGIYIPRLEVGESIENSIFANNFINNKVQVETWLDILVSNSWNLSYPFGGNYWSDYTGNDLYRGPHQNLDGSDGIGDSPHTYMDSNFDYYPLMAPLHILDVGTWDDADFQLIIMGNFNVSSLIFNPDLFGPSMNLTIVNSPKNGNCRIIIPQRLLWAENSSEWLLLLNGEPVDGLIMEDEKYTYIFFEFSEELFSISIFGTGVIPEFTVNIVLILTMFLACSFLVYLLKK